MIAIVVPVFRQGVLLFDAIASLGPAAEVAARAQIVLVDDGCPDAGTLFAGAGLALRAPHLHWLRGGNRGLSAARNRGIAFVLAALPEAEAIFFLDADNRLSPWSLAECGRALAAHPEADWFYPDISMFGLAQEIDYSGRFSPLVESERNLCEAGSLVRRRVFAAGLRFCEALREGFEDWDFWLGAIELGFRGRHWPGIGFRYRKRPESMLAAAHRLAPQIRAHLERRHPWIADLRWAVAAEHVTAPRYALWFVDRDTVQLGSSAELPGETLAWADYVARFWQAAHARKQVAAGAMVIAVTGAAWAALQAAGLLNWVLWDLERRLSDGAAGALVRVGRCDGAALTIDPPCRLTGDDTPGLPAALAALPMATLRALALQTDADWPASRAALLGEGASVRVVRLPQDTAAADPTADMAAALRRAVDRLRAAPHAHSGGFPQPDPDWGSPDLAEVPALLRRKFGRALLPPALAPSDGSDIAMVLPLFAFGGVERVALAVARELRRHGHRVSLVVLGARQIQPPPADGFERVFLLDDDAFADYSGPDYAGTALARWSVDGPHGEVVNLLSAFDAVIACHAGDALGVMAELRRRGVVTAVHLHLFDETASGRATGHPHLAVAFEHALDLVIGCSATLCRRLLALGIPAEKLVTVANAAGLDIPAAVSAAGMQGRRARSSGKLRVLSLGRLDAQKGIDRLADIEAVLAGRDWATLRVIGRSVLDDDAMVPAGLRRIAEPPATDDATLLAAYAWADVLLLPSRYEGLPLTLIEAMRMGVVPIAAAGGSIAEVIADGDNGCIVCQDDCVAAMLRHLRDLARDHDRRHAMMAAAAEAMAGRSWAGPVAYLHARLAPLLAARAARRRAMPPPGW